MPAALPNHQRAEIVERRQRGERFSSIARTMGISYEAVRKICHRYVKTGELGPGYERCRHTEVRHDPAIYHEAVALKQAHPSWGAGLIWTELAEAFDEADLPSQRTLQRWFRRAGVQRTAADRTPQMRVKRGKQAHEVWAIDAKEAVQLADGSCVSWLTVTDEGSGAILDAQLFPHQAVEQRRPDAGEGRRSGGDAPVGTSGTGPDG